MKLEQLQNKKIAIWGFGVEGQASAKYLNDKRIAFDVLANKEETNKANTDYVFITTTVDPGLLNQYDIIIKSPGISPYQENLKNVTAEFTSATALWFNNEKKVPVIAISGTKGKSTTSSCIAHVLKSVGFRVNLVGNIGEPLLLSSQEYDFIVLECSSYQTYDGEINPDFALITNLFPEHLDWHQNIENYYQDKLKLFKHSKLNVINSANQELKNRTQKMPVRYFNHSAGYWVQKQALYYQDELILKLSDIQLLGEHNLENIAAVLTLCNSIGINLQTAIAAVMRFQPLAHRLQSLGKIDCFYAINDSISSTPFATMAALKTQNIAQTIVLIGGYDRGIDWQDFFGFIDKNPPLAILLSGQNAGNISAQFKEYKFKQTQNWHQFKTLGQAIATAKNIAQEGTTILLSPGSPSFDAFKNYIQRGLFFENELKK